MKENSHIKKYFTILLGLFIFLVYIYLRFIRERLPREIPFKLTVLGFIILIKLCCIYCYIFLTILRNHPPIYKEPSNFKSVLADLRDFMMQPLVTLEEYITILSFVEPYYKSFFIKLSYKLDYVIKKTDLYYYNIVLLPRLIMILTLLLDVYYFHCLSHIYKIIYLGLIILLNMYLIYSLKKLKEKLLDNLESYLHQGELLITMNLNIIPLYEKKIGRTLTEEEIEWEEFPPTFRINIRDFIEYKTINHTKIIYYRFLAPSKLYDKYFCDKYKLPPDSSLNLAYSRSINKDFEQKAKNILQISNILFFYELSNNFDLSITKMKILIYANYFICWLYILKVSFHTLNIDDFIQMLECTWKDIMEPFTGVILEENIIEDKYTRMAYGLLKLLKQLKEYLYTKITTWI